MGWIHGGNKPTFGKLTLGTMTLCNALGASFGGFLGSPAGWYWYLKSCLAASPLELSVCHGMVPGATFTLASEVAEVGLPPSNTSQLKCSVSVEENDLTKVVAGQTKGTGHDTEENLRKM